MDKTIKQKLLEDELTFDNLRPYWTKKEVNDFALSAVLIRVRKIVRKELE